MKMKIQILFACLLVITLGAATRAQIAKPVAEDMQSSEKEVRNAPFSAQAVTESVQILSNGIRITRRMTSKLYRDNEGRLRREDSLAQLGLPGENVEIAASIRIMDPVSGFKYTLNTKDKTVKRSSFKPKFEWEKEAKFEEVKEKQWESLRKEDEERVKQAERQAKQEANVTIETQNNSETETNGVRVQNKDSRPTRKEGPDASIKPPANATQEKIDKNGVISKTEMLGARTIEGLAVEGARTTTTIPAGSIGNDRDIIVIYEKWYSKELQLTVMSKHEDPRFGEQTYRLTNISRNNPPIELFTPPDDYRITGDKDFKFDGPLKITPPGPKAPGAPGVKPNAPKKPTI